ncbi:MAG: hypothetical protein ACKOXB_05830 [Flavobacteriales bacterium]
MKKTGIVILIVAFFSVALQSCGSSHEVCPAYTKANVEKAAGI